jgi:hypothetical protein
MPNSGAKMLNCTLFVFCVTSGGGSTCQQCTYVRCALLTVAWQACWHQLCADRCCPSLQNPTFGQQVLELPAVTTVELQTGLGSVSLNIQWIVEHLLKRLFRDSPWGLDVPFTCVAFRRRTVPCELEGVGDVLGDVWVIQSQNYITL